MVSLSLVVVNGWEWGLVNLYFVQWDCLSCWSVDRPW